MTFIGDILSSSPVALVRPPAGAQTERQVGAAGVAEEEAPDGRPLHSEDQEELPQHVVRWVEHDGPRPGRRGADFPESIPQMPHHVQEDNTARPGTRVQTSPVLRSRIVPAVELRERLVEVSRLQVSSLVPAFPRPFP